MKILAALWKNGAMHQILLNRASQRRIRLVEMPVATKENCFNAPKLSWTLLLHCAEEVLEIEVRGGHENGLHAVHPLQSSQRENDHQKRRRRVVQSVLSGELAARVGRASGLFRPILMLTTSGGPWWPVQLWGKRRRWWKSKKVVIWRKVGWMDESHRCRPFTWEVASLCPVNSPLTHFQSRYIKLHHIHTTNNPVFF